MLRPSLIALALAANLTSASAADPPTNVVVVLCDDLGYGDLGCYGSASVQTPHLDRFAAQGLRLTSCYAAHPNCSPARAGLMTGRIPYRTGVHNWIPFLSPMHLRESEITIATLLRKRGYATCLVGKWHLNGWFNLPGQPQPSDHGFEHWFATQNVALPCHRHPYNFVRNGIPMGPLEGYAADLVADEAIRWLTQLRKKDGPFFLFVSFHEPHEPIATDDRFTKLYPGDPSRAAHHGNITQMDDAFGRLMKALDDAGVAEQTLVFFTSDNGPAITKVHPHGSAGPLRDKKGSVYEGGIRVPGLLRWPGRAQAGTTSDEPVSGVDLLPTLCEIAGIELPSDRVIDGVSFRSLFDGQPLVRSTPLYWQFNGATSRPKVAMRVGDWKLLAGLNAPDPPRGAHITEEQMVVLKTAQLDGFELYNLRDDVGEATDLSEREPERLAQMIEQLRPLYEQVRGESPTWPAWTWPNYDGPRIEWPAYRSPAGSP